MAENLQPSHSAVPPSDAAPSVTGTVVGDEGAADVIAPPSALHPDDHDGTDARPSLTGVELEDDADAEPDSLPDIDIVSE